MHLLLGEFPEEISSENISEDLPEKNVVPIMMLFETLIVYFVTSTSTSICLSLPVPKFCIEIIEKIM